MLSDPDTIDDESNLNRVVGAILEDAGLSDQNLKYQKSNRMPSFGC
ncbi:MAG: hypothetical protein IPI46_08100 [Bacteroidetes bacterium]|nr:hypothetical protein [Bacteroidota bacterium]